MGNSTHQFSVLHQRRTAHPLHDTAGGGKQGRVGDAQGQVAIGILPAAAHPLNAHGVMLGGAAREGRPQLGIAGVYLARRGDGQHRPDILCRGGPAAIQAGGIVARHDAENVR